MCCSFFRNFTLVADNFPSGCCRPLSLAVILFFGGLGAIDKRVTRWGGGGGGLTPPTHPTSQFCPSLPHVRRLLYLALVPFAVLLPLLAVFTVGQRVGLYPALISLRCFIGRRTALRSHLRVRMKIGEKPIKNLVLPDGAHSRRLLK